MKRWWALYVARLAAMKPRERVLASAAAILVPAAIVFVVYIAPALIEQKATRARMEKQRAELAAVESTTTGAVPEADGGYRDREGLLKRELGEADETLKALYRTLVPANRAPELLRQMIAEERALELVSLRTLP